MKILAEETLLKKQGFHCTNNSNFLVDNKQDISHMGKGHDLPCCITKVL